MLKVHDRLDQQEVNYRAIKKWKTAIQIECKLSKVKTIKTLAYIYAVTNPGYKT